MRRQCLVGLVFACALGWAAPSFAQCTSTPNLGLCKGARSALDWDQFLNANFDLLDALVVNTGGVTQAKSGVLSLGGLVVPTLASGGVLVAGAAGAIGVDATNFYWDDANNRLGILTGAPAYPLDVAGTVRVTGLRMATGAVNGYVLKTDANGVGTWQVEAGGASGGGWTDAGATVHLITGTDKISLTGTSATEKLEVGGAVLLGGSVGTATGLIRWDGGSGHFQGYNGSTWVNLDETAGLGGAGGWTDSGTQIDLTTSTDNVRMGGAGAVAARLQVEGGTDLGLLALLSQSLTGSSASALLDMSGTWNTSGVPTAIKLTLTDSASGAASKLVDLIVGGSSKFSIAKTGALTTVSTINGYTPSAWTQRTASETISGNWVFDGPLMLRSMVNDAYLQFNNVSQGVWAQSMERTNAGRMAFVNDLAGTVAFNRSASGNINLIGGAPYLNFDQASGTDWHLAFATNDFAFYTGAPGAGVLQARLSNAGDFSFPTLTLTSGLNSSLIPTTNDAFDLGRYDRLFDEAWISNLNAVLFVENQISVVAGWMIVAKNQGTFGAGVTSGATTIDFGSAVTPGDWVVVRAKDTSGAVKAEYLLVGALVSGTTYNVTRDVLGSHVTDPAWAAGTVWVDFGASGDGRVEFNAFDTPRISILAQGASPNTSTDLVRLGSLDGISGVPSGKLGAFIGDGSSYLRYYDGTLTIAGNGTGLTQINGSNITTGSINADLITTGTLTGRTLRTAAFGQRVEIDSTNGLRGIDSGGVTQVQIGVDGKLSWSAGTGQMDAAGIRMSTSGSFTVGGSYSFYNQTAPAEMTGGVYALKGTAGGNDAFTTVIYGGRMDADPPSWVNSSVYLSTIGCNDAGGCPSTNHRSLSTAILMDGPDLGRKFTVTLDGTVALNATGTITTIGGSQGLSVTNQARLKYYLTGATAAVNGTPADVAWNGTVFNSGFGAAGSSPSIPYAGGYLLTANIVWGTVSGSSCKATILHGGVVVATAEVSGSAANFTASTMSVLVSAAASDLVKVQVVRGAGTNDCELRGGATGDSNFSAVKVW